MSRESLAADVGVASVCGYPGEAACRVLIAAIETLQHRGSSLMVLVLADSLYQHCTVYREMI